MTPFCSSGTDFNTHMQYEETGMVDQAATFTANHVLAALALPPLRKRPALSFLRERPLPWHRRKHRPL